MVRDDPAGHVADIGSTVMLLTRAMERLQGEVANDMLLLGRLDGLVQNALDAIREQQRGQDGDDR